MVRVLNVPITLNVPQTKLGVEAVERKKKFPKKNSPAPKNLVCGTLRVIGTLRNMHNFPFFLGVGHNGSFAGRVYQKA